MSLKFLQIMIKYIIGIIMNSKFKEHLKTYYLETNKKLPDESRSKTSVGKKERFPTIIFGYLLIISSFIPLFYIKSIEKDTFKLFGPIFLLGLMILYLSNFSFTKVLITYKYYKNIDLYYNDILYELLLKKKETKKTFVKNFFHDNKRYAMIVFFNKVVCFSLKEKVKIKITSKKIKVYKNRKQVLLLNDYSLNNKEIYTIIKKYI